MKKALIFLNGELNTPKQFLKQENEILIIAADGGANFAFSLGYKIDFLIGDLDSLSAEMLKEIQKTDTIIKKYPAEKDEIDFELAVNLALENNIKQIDVLAAFGGRWDMFLANMLLPVIYFSEDLQITFWHGDWSIQVLKGPKKIIIKGEVGDSFSLIPLSYNIKGIKLVGSQYPLNGESLKMGTSRGLSNAFQEKEIFLSFEEGALLFVKGKF